MEDRAVVEEEERRKPLPVWKERWSLGLGDSGVGEGERRSGAVMGVEREGSLVLDGFRLGARRASLDSPAAGTQKTGQG